ncbi:MAG: urease accessory protein UreE [Alphaproteobacteria bacterium]
MSPLRLGAIVCDRTAPEVSERLHRLAHAGRVETLSIEPRDAARGRLRLATDQGTDCAIAQPRGQRLHDGAVLFIDEVRAIVVRVGEQRWLGLRPRDDAAALQLGYQAGNLHWRVRFRDADLFVALDGPEAEYLARLRDLVASGAVTVCDD